MFDTSLQSMLVNDFCDQPCRWTINGTNDMFEIMHGKQKLMPGWRGPQNLSFRKSISRSMPPNVSTLVIDNIINIRF